MSTQFRNIFAQWRNFKKSDAYFEAVYLLCFPLIILAFRYPMYHEYKLKHWKWYYAPDMWWYNKKDYIILPPIPNAALPMDDQ